MSKINTIIDYKIQVFYKDAPILSEGGDNPHTISPYRIQKEDYNLYLVYNVTNRGKTLRSFIESIHQPRQKSSFRYTFNKGLRIDPLDLLLKLIDTCENLLISNKLFSQAHINPDLIWIDSDNNNQNLIVKLLDILDCETAYEARSETIYLSPELLRKRNNLLNLNSIVSDNYLTNIQINKQMSLKRYDTRPSTLSTVYSLGLVLYYIVMAKDPYEVYRIHIDERPDLANVPSLIAKIIWAATYTDPKDRPTLKEFRDIIIVMRNPKSKWCI